MPAGSTLELTANAPATDGVVEWQVVTFDGATVQTGDLPYTASNSTVSTTMTAVDQAATWLVFSYDVATVAVDAFPQKLFRGRFSNAATPWFQREGNGSAGTLSWFAVSFTNGTTVTAGLSSLINANLTANPYVISTAGHSIATVGGPYFRSSQTNVGGSTNIGACMVTSTLASPALTLTRATAGVGGANCYLSWYVTEFK